MKAKIADFQICIKVPLMSCGSRDYSKMHLVSCTTNHHHNVIDLVNHGIVKNTKT